jgi:ATP-dependent DNA helicase 2 subunit 2
MGEVQYIWADPGSPGQQVALSSIVRGMARAKVMAICRLVSRDGMDPKMGALTPCTFEKVDCLLWVQVRGDQIGERLVLMKLADAVRG